MSQFIPNSFQVPNAIIDEMMAELSGSEFKSLLLYFRYAELGIEPPREVIFKNGLQDRYHRTISALKARGLL
ncbi:hypothetical protein BKG91_12105 [Rodentibacter caecimuris]|uniref:hypothetical protein n=1 Tax=Rodentibacter caecimuris TaxID=1796644 RepID=UPI00075127AF|nr:hypothetical protein [Rodentibacter heylii]AOF53688.1 hypothetical protein AC062_1596 [Pasteurellaceae bacterium NI1060]OOF69980.1 hypothetical protein BKG91_12105 [Rodentibacter heylii]